MPDTTRPGTVRRGESVSYYQHESTRLRAGRGAGTPRVGDLARRPPAQPDGEAHKRDGPLGLQQSSTTTRQGMQRRWLRPSWGRRFADGFALGTTEGHDDHWPDCGGKRRLSNCGDARRTS